MLFDEVAGLMTVMAAVEKAALPLWAEQDACQKNSHTIRTNRRFGARIGVGKRVDERRLTL
jgi:hypothetical protein